jgi:hypothetical protein
MAIFVIRALDWTKTSVFKKKTVTEKFWIFFTLFHAYGFLLFDL